MKIRFCNKEDIDYIRELWEYCFNDSPEYVDFYFENKFSPENTILLDDQGRAVSSIHMNQHSLSLNFKKFDVSYIVGVSTLPEVRGSGKMKELMEYSLRHMYESGQEVGILMPIDFRLYRRYGFENCYDMLVQNLDVDDLRKFKISGEFKKAKKAEDLEEIYRYSQSLFNGYAIRDKKYFEQFIDEMDRDGAYIYINYIDSCPEGYIAYSFEDNKMIVRECYYKSIESYKSILRFIYNHNTQVKKVEIYSAISDPLRHMLDNPKDSQFEIKPFMMGRVINFEKLIEKLDIACDEDFQAFKIAVEDKYIDENNGIFEFYKEVNKVRVRKIGDLYELEDIDIFTINELSAMFFGYMKVEDVDFMRERKIVCIIEMRELLESIYDTNTINHINEYV